MSMPINFQNNNNYNIGNPKPVNVSVVSTLYTTSIPILGQQPAYSCSSN